MSMVNQSLAPIKNVNHVAYRCRDAEQTRWFYEDVLGLPLKIAFAEDVIPGFGTKMPFMHLFFGLGNGDYIAFFDEPNRATPENFEPADSFDRHIAFEVDSLDEVLKWQKSINEKGVMCLGPIPHGFVTSVYMYDPNGLQVEITTKTDEYDEYTKKQEEDSRVNLKDWVEKTREQKLSKFGLESLDLRSINYPLPGQS